MLVSTRKKLADYKTANIEFIISKSHIPCFKNRGVTFFPWIFEVSSPFLIILSIQSEWKAFVVELLNALWGKQFCILQNCTMTNKNKRPLCKLFNHVIRVEEICRFESNDNNTARSNAFSHKCSIMKVISFLFDDSKGRFFTRQIPSKMDK